MSTDKRTAARVDKVVPDLSPWLRVPLADLLRQRGHAWLLQGASGLGQYELALALASAWLCEQPKDDGTACGHCTSCHAIEVRTHADLCVLMPEVAMMELGWPLDEKSQSDIDDKKRKPSREIRVEAMRDALNNIPFDGTIVIGEGERDEAPMLFIGEKVGSAQGTGPKIDIALDPLEGTTICAKAELYDLVDFLAVRRHLERLHNLRIITRLLIDAQAQNVMTAGREVDRLQSRIALQGNEARIGHPQQHVDLAALQRCQ